MTRICVVTQDIRLGGVLTKLMAFLRFAELRGDGCDIYYSGERPAPPEDIARLRQIPSVEQLHPVHISEKVPHFVRAAAFGRRCRFTGSYDAYQLISGSLALGLPLVRRGYPFVAWVAGPAQREIAAMRRTKLRHYYFYNALTVSALRRQEIRCGLSARIVLADSHYAARGLASDLRLPREKLRVLATPIDLDMFQPGSGLIGPRRYVLSVSRLARGKGFPTLLRAFREVARAIDDVDLRIAGDGAERNRLESMTAELGLDRRVTFLGELRGPALIDAYRNATLFVLPSHFETLSIVVLEAMACGLPVIATACGGPADHVQPGATGFLVPVEDWSSMAQHMLVVLRDADLAALMRHAARRRAAETFGADIINHRLHTLYRDIFNADRPAASALR